MNMINPPHVYKQTQNWHHLSMTNTWVLCSFRYVNLLLLKSMTNTWVLCSFSPFLVSQSLLTQLSYHMTLQTTIYMTQIHYTNFMNFVD